MKNSITPTCMVYQNHTARQINPKIYNKPYIGSEAYKKQLELKGIRFGEDEYKFHFSASKTYDKFYNMIMDENNLGGHTLFTGLYHQKTQTPYYVAIVASFVQLYDSVIHEDKLGIILLDEAFDKMDENRIESMMTFFNKLDLQLIIASPPQKIETIGPHVGTTLVITKEDNFSWVEAFRIDEEL